MKSELIMAVNQICAEKDLPLDVIMGAIEEALVHAYRRNYANNLAVVKVDIDADTGDLRVLCEKAIVETVTDPSVEINLAAAHVIDPQAEIGGTVLVEREPTDFGRIAAQTAKQVILQRIHEAERDAVYESYRQREGELITGSVQSIDYRTGQVTITLGKKAEGILAKEDQLPNERYRVGVSVRSLLAEVHKGPRGPQIRLSRAHRSMLRRLLEREVPEIYSGAVEIKSIAREPGQRSKVAVAATQPGVDPVGSCVGMRGTRIQNIVDELSGEKIDVVEWSNDVRQFISNALSPAKPGDTVLIEDGDVRTAIVVVPDRQLSLAIGKEGQNARLAAKLTGWRIDIKSETEAATEGLAEIKRQQMQLLKTRSLEAKAPTAAPGDDLLSRAEWLLREKDKAAVTLEQAAKLLADSDSTTKPDMIEAEKPATGEPAPASPGAADVAAPPVEGAEPVKPTGVVLEPEFLELELEGAPFPAKEEEEEEDDEVKREKRRKASKKRQLVFDERLGEVVSRRKRKPSRQDWGDDLSDY
ncbi:MAG: transcription termination/antitermination protein NusA [Chloroflexi bacterium HGW-Chloroflexi-1]|nr:MAG: transcription termination/antitermination protein NusA [Chloroflexi bacterium HGW-Chloroflexi-1]